MHEPQLQTEGPCLRKLLLARWGKGRSVPPGFGRCRGGGGGGNAPMANTTVAAMNAGAEASYVLVVITELPPDDLPAMRAFLTMPTQSRTYADSGATDHCFANREDFTTYLAYNPPHTGRTANKDGTLACTSWTWHHLPQPPVLEAQW